MLNWGLVGTGRHAETRIVPALWATKAGRLLGVVGSSEAKGREFATRLGVARAYPSIDDMLADPEIDAVFICTPNHLHRLQTERAAAAGKHVLVEKPMAMNEEEARAMLAACRAAGVRLGVGFHARWHPVHRRMRQLIAEGSLGRIVLARAEWHSAYARWTNWRGDTTRGGADVLYSVGVHPLDLLCYLVGSEPEEVSAFVDRADEAGQDQTVACWLRFAGGALATLTMTRLSAWPLNSVHVWGTEGTAGGVGTLGMSPAGCLRTTRGSDVVDTELPVSDLYAEQFSAFAKAVEHGEEPEASGLDGLRSVIVAQAILGTSQHRRSVLIDLDSIR